MVLTYAEQILRARKNKQKHIEKVNSGDPIRSKRKRSSPLPISNERIPRSNLRKRHDKDLPTTTAKKFKAAANQQDQDTILLPDESEDIDELYLTEEQVDKMFRAIQTAANFQYRVKYVCADELLSDSPQLPSIRDTDIIVIPLPLGVNGQINLAVFELSTSSVWLFCRYYHQSFSIFNKIKQKMMNNYNKNFQLESKIASDKLINKRSYSYNDIILVFRTAEELFFTGSVKKFDNFNLDAERKRYRDIYDLMNSNDWDGNLPPTLQSEDRNDNEEEDNDDTLRNGTSATSLSNDIQIIESSETSGGTNNSRSTINDARSSVSGYYDFDDLQSLSSPVPIPSTPQSFDSSEIPSSSFLHSSSSNVVNNQLNSSILPSIRQLVSYSISTTSSISDHGLITTASTQNDQADLSNLENENIESSVIASQDDSTPNYDDDPWMRSDYSPPIVTRSESYHSPPRPTTATPLIISQQWDINYSPPRQFFEERHEASSLSEFDDNDDDDSTQEIPPELSPKHYPEEASESSEDENANDEWKEREANYRMINMEIRKYWKCVRQLVADRERFIAIIDQKISKSRCYSYEETIRINVKLELIEKDLNEIIPVLHKWKATYEKDSNKSIILRNGYIYQRIGESNNFQCTYEYQQEKCYTYLCIDDNDYIVEGSFCEHHHVGYKEFVFDDPIPAVPVSFPRIYHPNAFEEEKYEKIMNLLDKLLAEIGTWRGQIILCQNNLELIKRCLSELENKHTVGFSRSNQISTKSVIMDAKNILNCIRLHKHAS